MKYKDTNSKHIKKVLSPNAEHDRGRLSGVKQIVNSFVFPGDKGSGIQYLGYADVDNNSDFGVINALSLDCKSAIMAYALHEESSYREEYLLITNKKM